MSRAHHASPRRSKSRRYVGRQRIVDVGGHTIGYELLYRGNRTHSEPISQHPNPSQDTLDCSVLMGLDALCDKRVGFFNCNREVLTGSDIRLLPASRVVLEILEDIPPDAEVLDACVKLKRLGFQLALDDFVPTTENLPYLEVVDLLKVDFQSVHADAAAAICHRFENRFQMIAEKVETQDEFEFAKRCGYSLFQGFLFGRPEILSTRAVSAKHLQAVRAAAIAPPVYELSLGSEVR